MCMNNLVVGGCQLLFITTSILTWARAFSKVVALANTRPVRGFVTLYFARPGNLRILYGILLYTNINNATQGSKQPIKTI